MDRCEALGCTSEVTPKGGEYSFFPIPTDPKLKNSWETNLGRSDLPQSSVICEKHFSSQDVIWDENAGKTLKLGAVPSMFGDKTIEEGDSHLRRSSRKRVPKKSGISRGGNKTQSTKKKAARPLFKTATKPPEKNKRLRASKNEDENFDPNHDLLVKRTPGKRRTNKKSIETTPKSPEKLKLIVDDERGHAIAEWYLVDVFEATRVITSVLRRGTLVTDNLVANMEETIIEMISKLLQRLSSVLITSLEEEFGINCNIMAVLTSLHENIKENVNQLAAEEKDDRAILIKPEEDSYEPEDSYEQALRRLDFKDSVRIIEEVISPPIDEDCMLIEHSYSRPSEQEEEKNQKTKRGGLHNMRPKLQCGFCAFKTYWKSKLRRHIKHHLHYKKRFECSTCDYSATTTEAYNKHIRTHTGEKPFSCDSCNFRTANKSNLNRHYVIHLGIKPFACPYCEHTSRQKGSMEHHIATHTTTLKERGRGQKSVYACGDCNFITILRAEFISHAKTHKKYNCGHCDFVGKEYQELRVHQAMHNGTGHACQLCRRKCKTADELRVHLETHNEMGKELVCELCSYRTIRPAYFKRHVACHSGERPFKCDVCLSTFRLQSHLTMHVRKHEIGPFCKKSSM